MNLRFHRILACLALLLPATAFAAAQDTGGCAPRQRAFGIILDSTAPAAVMRVAIVASGWGGSLGGLKAGDEILNVNDQKVPLTSIDAQTSFLTTLPASANVFRIRRGATITTLSVVKTCPPPKNREAMAEFRAKLLLLVSEQEKHFAEVTGARSLPEEQIGAVKVKESTVHLFKDDFPMIRIDPKLDFTYYFNRLRSGMTEPASARFFALWSATIAQTLPEYQSNAQPVVYGIADRIKFTKGTEPTCEISLSRTVSNGVYTVALTVSTTKEPSWDPEDLSE